MLIQTVTNDKNYTSMLRKSEMKMNTGKLK